MDYKKLFALIDEHNIISFDVFDTLINRNMPKATDLFKIVEIKYFQLFGENIDFAKKRKLAEKLARKNGDFYEVNLDEIYNQMLNFYAGETIRRLEDLEIKTEIGFSCPNKQIFDVFEECKRKGKTIFIVSDMYLPKSVIGEMLSHCGYSGYNKLYISCEVRKTKWQDGLLYKAILEENNITGSGVLHIGNDKTADYVMAKKQGLSAFLISENCNCKYYDTAGLSGSEKLQYDCIEKFVSNNFIGMNKPNSYKLGFEVFGPLLYGYCNWLSEKAQEFSIDKIYFFSRDGYVLKQGFELLNPHIKTCYFYASRRSIITALLCFDDTLEEMLSHYKSWPKMFNIKFLFDKFDLDFTIFESLVSKYNISDKMQFTYDTLLQNKNVKLLFEELKPCILKNSVRAFDVLLKYIYQVDMSGKIAMVDIGAGCSIEIAFREFIKKANLNIDLWAFNMQTYKEETKQRKNYIDTSNKNKEIYSIWRFCYMLLEVFLSAPHGTVLGYDINNGFVSAVLGKYEYADKNGKVDEPVLISNLQQGALDFVRKYNVQLAGKIPISNNLALKNFKKFGLTPYNDDLAEWGDFRFDSDKFEPLVKCRSLKTYIANTHLFINDFKNSMWPAGFLMQCFKSRKLNMGLYKLYKCCK